MPIDFTADPVPLRYDEGGTIRVGKTRVRLASVIWEFQQGADAETIVADYDTLELADVYAVLAFHLRRRPEVDAYLAEQEQFAEQLREEIEARFDSRGFLVELEARAAGRRASA